MCAKMDQWSSYAGRQLRETICAKKNYSRFVGDELCTLGKSSSANAGLELFLGSVSLAAEKCRDLVLTTNSLFSESTDTGG